MGEEGGGGSQGNQPSSDLVEVRSGLSISVHLHLSVSLSLPREPRPSPKSD